MSSKVYKLIVGVSSGVAAIAVAFVSFFQPPFYVAINAAIPIVEGCIAEVCSLFVIPEEKKAKK
jgi:hypothetical protein